MYSNEERLNLLRNTIDENIDLLPDILNYVSSKLTEFKNKVKKENDIQMVNALGSACQLLSMKRRPVDMKRACILIEKAHFPNGLESWHHEGEKAFYNRFLR